MCCIMFRHKCGYGQTKTMHACSNPSQSLPEKGKYGMVYVLHRSYAYIAMLLSIENFREFRISSTEGTICASSNPCHSIPVNDYYREEIRSTNKQARHSYSNLCQPLSVHGDYGKCRMSTTEDFMGTSSIPGQSFPVDEQLTEETMSTTKTIHTCSILCQSLPANGQLREDEITATSETIQSLTNLCQSLPVYDHYREHRMYTVESLHTCSNPSLVEDTYDTMPTIDVCNILRYIKVKFCDVLIPMEFINKQHSLGKGAFGIVHKGELVESDGSVTPIAIKTIKSSRLDSLKELVAETAIMKNFSHPNVLQLLGVCVDSSDDDMFKVILPYMPNGDLRGFLRKNRVEPTNTHDFPENIDECGLIRMCTDIAKGMEYLSDKRFVHRDLAARNCMVDVNLNVRVADFGLTRDIYSTEYYRIEKHTTLPVKWMALESLLDGYFDEKTDVWSYGVTCWEIFSLGRIPYPGLDNGNVITVLKHGKRLDKPILCSQKLYNLLQTTWLESAPDRPSFGEIVKTLIGSTLS
ncbi:tyrosine-protein kinase receptor UFO-like isoform X2 [Dysidea avara]|uniref:tyrosine-protein kinase receptor UFO-like isoform X2 n=2 Tax=Dysidea avara TaxID=196820 RepID=UPI0033318E5F